MDYRCNGAADDCARFSFGTDHISTSPSPALLPPSSTTTTVRPPHGPLKCNVVQFVNMPKTYIDHTYRDFSENLPQDDEDADVDVSQWQRMDSNQMTFHQRLYQLLSYTSSSSCCSPIDTNTNNVTNNYDHRPPQQPPQHDHSIVWCSHGRAFRIVDRETFV